VKAHQQHRQGVDQPLGGIRAKALAEQCAIRQGELQVLREQAGVELLAVG